MHDGSCIQTIATC